MLGDYIYPGNEFSMGYVRVIHTVPDAPNVDIYANDMLIASNLSYGNYTDYIPVPEGTYQVSLYAAGSKDTPVISNLLTISRNLMMTVAAIGMQSNIEFLAITDADMTSKQNKAMLRFLHLSPNAPAVDITYPDGTVLFSNVAYKQITPYVGVTPMNYTLQVRAAQTPTVVLTIPNLDLVTDKFSTIYAIGLVGQTPELEALLLSDGK